MKKAITITLVLIPMLINAQKTKKIINKETHESYYVLKSDKNIKHGEYIKYGFNDKVILLKGFYKMNKKDSIWEGFNTNGKLDIKYDYTNSKLIYYKVYKKDSINSFDNLTEKDTILNRPPIFSGAIGLIIPTVFENIKYPESAKENGISGQVIVTFKIDKNGKMSDFHVDNPLGYGLDEEAIRVLKLIPEEWLPALKDGKPVDSKFSFPVNYRLS